MKKLKNILTGILIAGILGGTVFYFRYRNGSRNAVSGIAEPIQTETNGSIQLTVNDYHLTVKYLYEYDIEALVVHTHDYSGGSIGDTISATKNIYKCVYVR